MRLYEILLWFALLNTGGITAYSESPQQYFRKGNNYYQQQQFAKALQNYQKIEAMDFQSASLYYNMANSYYKMDSIPEAILYYERALRLEPTDEDIRHNLKKAREQTVDKIEPLPRLFFIRWWNQFTRQLSPGGWGILAVIAIWVSMGGGAFFLWTYRYALRKASFFTGLIAFGISIFSVILAQKQYHYQHRKDQAIVFAPSLYVKYGPDSESTNKFVLHKGTKVIIKDQMDKWVKIRLMDGKTGWMKKNALRYI